MSNRSGRSKNKSQDRIKELDRIKSATNRGLVPSGSQASRVSARSKPSKLVPDEYDPNMAIEFERLETKSFKQSFFEKMEEINYDRYIEQEKWRGPQF